MSILNRYNFVKTNAGHVIFINDPEVNPCSMVEINALKEYIESLEEVNRKLLIEFPEFFI